MSTCIMSSKVCVIELLNSSNGLNVKGDISKPLILLLHGYPECWFSWRGQLRGLNLEDYCLVAPDMRGYGDSEKPMGVSNYKWPVLVEDIKCLIRALGKIDVW